MEYIPHGLNEHIQNPVLCTILEWHCSLRQVSLSLPSSVCACVYKESCCRIQRKGEIGKLSIHSQAAKSARRRRRPLLSPTFGSPSSSSSSLSQAKKKKVPQYHLPLRHKLLSSCMDAYGCNAVTCSSLKRFTSDKWLIVSYAWLQMNHSYRNMTF